MHKRAAAGIVLLVGVAALLLYITDTGTRTTLPDYTQALPAASAQGVYVGEWECLPHANPADTTEECALGIKTDAGAHYALDIGSLASVPGVAAGARVRIEGTLQNTTWDKFIMEGVLHATRVTTL